MGGGGRLSTLKAQVVRLLSIECSRAASNPLIYVIVPH